MGRHRVLKRGQRPNGVELRQKEKGKMVAFPRGGSTHIAVGKGFPLRPILLCGGDAILWTGERNLYIPSQRIGARKKEEWTARKKSDILTKVKQWIKKKKRPS